MASTMVIAVSRAKRLTSMPAMLTLVFGFAALYLWLELKLGTIAALGVLGGVSAVLAGALFAVAFLPASRKPRARAEGALRVTADPTAAIAQAANEAMNGAADIVRNGSRQQIAGTVAVAVLIGWVLGRRF